jgi:hypothetical protein
MVATATDINGPSIHGKGLFTHKQKAVAVMAKQSVARVKPHLPQGHCAKN